MPPAGWVGRKPSRSRNTWKHSARFRRGWWRRVSSRPMRTSTSAKSGWGRRRTDEHRRSRVGLARGPPRAEGVRPRGDREQERQSHRGRFRTSAAVPLERRHGCPPRRRRDAVRLPRRRRDPVERSRRRRAVRHRPGRRGASPMTDTELQGIALQALNLAKRDIEQKGTLSGLLAVSYPGEGLKRMTGVEEIIVEKLGEDWLSSSAKKNVAF